MPLFGQNPFEQDVGEWACVLSVLLAYQCDTYSVDLACYLSQRVTERCVADSQEEETQN